MEPNWGQRRLNNQRPHHEGKHRPAATRKGKARNLRAGIARCNAARGPHPPDVVTLKDGDPAIARGGDPATITLLKTAETKSLKAG